YAEAVRIPAGVTVDGGEGVGRVTKPGLDQPVGAAAINSTPRRMIEENVAAVCAAAGYTGGVAVTVSIPGGAEIAQRTFNPRMGVEGGLSVLGTSGIVEPMSTRALADTVRLELRQLRAEGEDTVLLVPGNYGHDFAENELGLSVERCVSCANFIGEAIDAAVELGFRQILLVGHVGKLVKLGIGVTNTHSSAGDGRMETLAACAALAGAEGDLIRGVLGCATTDAALTLLAQAGRKEDVCALLGSRIDDTLNRRVPPGVEIGCVMFTNRAELGPVLWRSENAERLTKNWRRTI
ncbi:MAG: cobalamin biosynthesis protein CbiD, partial [Oscillospiraceae bacterium]|nr:cobalamin biosynthesis protein CbiD [Oscillospiraceae bacterium]